MEEKTAIMSSKCMQMATKDYPSLSICVRFDAMWLLLRLCTLRRRSCAEFRRPYWLVSSCQEKLRIKKTYIGIYHAKVSTSHPDATNGGEICRMEFLWVRWLGAEPDHRHGFSRAVLPKIGFVPSTDEYTFGFLDPKHVIRGCHLIPAFTCGRTSDLLPVENTDARRLQRYGRACEILDDCMNFYVNM